MEKSTHKVEVVEVNFSKHPNADSLSITPVFGYTCIGRTDDWKGIKKAAWIPPDSLVNVNLPEFAFLAGETRYAFDSTKNHVALNYARIRAKKLRGSVSYGMLVPVNDSVEVGTDMAEHFGVLHYDPPVNDSGNPKNRFYSGGEVASPPEVLAPKYDLDSFQRYAKNVFVQDELVIATEKIHGASARYVFDGLTMHCGSHSEWKKEYSLIPVPDKVELVEKIKSRFCSDIQGNEMSIAQAGEQADYIIDTINFKNSHPKQNMFWAALANHPEIRSWCEAHPGVVVYGEVYGQVQNLKYGLDGIKIAVFDIMHNGTWTDAHAARLAAPELPWVPTVVDSFAFDFDKLVALAEGPSLVTGANHIREGIVVCPLQERYDHKVGRVKLKIVSVAYLERK